MAQCKLTPQEFIKDAFTPQIAVLCSSSVDQICQKNNLSFVELVQPFCKLSADVNMQDGNGGTIIIHNLRVKLMDVNFRPPQPTLARKLLNAAVAQASEPRTQLTQIGENNLQIPTSTPWFEAWRDMFLQVQFPSDHEFTKHYLACMLVVSSADTNPVEAMNHLDQNLNQLQNVAPNKLPKWFSSHILRYYVMLHDNIDGDNNKTTQAIDALNLCYGIGKVFLLKINSRPQGQVEEQLPDPWSQYVSTTFESTDSSRPSPDDSPNTSRSLIRTLEGGLESMESGVNLPYHPLSPETEAQKLNEALLEKEIQAEPLSSNALHGMFLTTSDVEQIKLLIHEFCTRALLPYVERQIQNLTEIVSNKKGVSKSLFSATKRWFTPSKAGSSNGSSNLPIYASDAPELQMRKLGDLYFMFNHYNMAFQVYHAAKRDFNSDQAWFYYAGALEMAALAAFMANECNRKTCDYIEEGIVTYLNVCKMAQFATRATLLSSECLKSRNLHGEAAHQLIRMTSEESDLRSALLLEQAAYCFLNCVRSPMVRKYAFHMVLAGHRFSKAAQKKHALRCYKQALEVYQNKGWSFAEDHVHYTIGKLSLGLNLLEEAADSFSKLLTIQSKQSVEQQTLFLKEYLSTQRMLLESGCSQESPILSLPLLISEAIKILVGPTPPLSIPGKVRALGISFTTCDDTETKQKWSKLEEMIVQEAQGSLPLIFKPVITLYTKDNINSNLIAIVNEPIQVSLKLHNPLSVTITLKDIYLLWKFKSENGNTITNEKNNRNSDSFLKTSVIKSLVLPSNNSQEIVLFVTPLIVGELSLKGIYYNILDLDGSEDVTAVCGKQLFDLKKLGYTRKEVVQDINTDQSIGLLLSIMPPAPCLQVNFEDINIEMLCNEIKSVTMEMRNVGSVPLHKVFLATSTPQLLSCCEFRETTQKAREVVDLEVPAVRERVARKNHVTQVALPDGCLEPGHSSSVNIWIKAPNVKGPVCIDLLIYYENSNSTSVPRYRLIRHVWILKIYESLKIQLGVTESCKSEDVKELLFEVKATNMNKVYLNALSEVTLLKAGLLSSCWKLKPLENLRDYQSLTINSEQSTYLLLRGERRITKYDKYYEIPLVTETSTTKNLAYVDFAKGIEQSKINIFEDTVITKNKPVREGMLFFQWRACVIDNFKNEKIGSGQTFVPIERVRYQDENEQDGDGTIVLYDPNQPTEVQVPKNEKNSTEDLQTQVSMGIINNPCVDHNFEENEVCIIPVKISIHNDSHVESIITVNTAGTNSASPPPIRPNLFCPYPSKDYRWVGFSGTVKTIPPLSSEVIMLNVAVSSPGVYDLGGRLEVWCQNDLHPEPLLQDLQALGFLSVRSINQENVTLSDVL